MTATLSALTDRTARASGRLGWLDAVRGFAAVTVVLFHLSPRVIGPELHLAILRHFNLGKYGVLLFFLVSGYVVPMSLERHGSLRRFWISRVFRIWPAYLLSIAVMLVLIAAGFLVLPESLQRETASGVLGHAAMLQEFLGLRGIVRVLWTLSFEMIFYLIVAGLFAWKLHRLSAWWAGGLTVIAVAGGRRLPNGLITSTFAERRITAVVMVLLLAGSVLAYVSGRRGLTIAAGAAGICCVLLPAVSGSPTRWSTAASSSQALLLLAVMFAGTVIYRAERGELAWRTAVPTLAVVAVGLAIAGWVSTGSTAQLRLWGANTAAVALTFGAAFVLRHRAMPRVLTWLGAVSYSLYLLHLIALSALARIAPRSGDDNAAETALLAIMYLGFCLAVAWLSYRLVELPGQHAGRRVQRALDARLGPDCLRPQLPPRVPGPVRAGARIDGGASRLDERARHRDLAGGVTA